MTETSNTNNQQSSQLSTLEKNELSSLENIEIKENKEKISFNKEMIIIELPFESIFLYSICILSLILSLFFYILSLQSLNLLEINSKNYFSNWLKKIGLYLIFSSLFLSFIYQMIIQKLVNTQLGKISVFIYLFIFIFQKGNSYYDHGLFNFFGLIFFTFYFFCILYYSVIIFKKLKIKTESFLFFIIFIIIILVISFLFSYFIYKNFFAFYAINPKFNSYIKSYSSIKINNTNFSNYNESEYIEDEEDLINDNISKENSTNENNEDLKSIDYLTEDNIKQNVNTSINSTNDNSKSDDNNDTKINDNNDTINNNTNIKDNDNIINNDTNIKDNNNTINNDTKIKDNPLIEEIYSEKPKIENKDPEKECEKWGYGLGGKRLEIKEESKKNNNLCYFKYPTKCYGFMYNNIYDKNREEKIYCSIKNKNSKEKLIEYKGKEFKNTSTFAYPITRNYLSFSDVTFDNFKFPKKIIKDIYDIKNPPLNSPQPEVTVTFDNEGNGKVNIEITKDENLIKNKSKLFNKINPKYKNVYFIFILFLYIFFL